MIYKWAILNSYVKYPERVVLMETQSKSWYGSKNVKNITVAKKKQNIWSKNWSPEWYSTIHSDRVPQNPMVYHHFPRKRW